ncbi:MAG: SDR family NAD(P)-dependent oxidoreductase [Propionibacteriaceae bacterium]|jgi:rhamnose utilization protein RhaD (predicted bifunctional aldolase and dehydrogenase)/NAD(P)-dependent dehydrogenase (short-subunit alcohol dehydrogenase family)|nr:SDR family NAD(P)-dependent oxidoreductase [Propionibacteriaceae bacterium]
MTSNLIDQVMDLVQHFQGSEYTRAGGGNVSYKVDGVLHIKPSGLRLADITPLDLIPLSQSTLLEQLAGEGLDNHALLTDGAAAARVGVDDGRRPSVELYSHAVLAEALVVHLHPLTLSALACTSQAHQLAAEILGDSAIVVDYADPGVPLALALLQARQAFTERTGRQAPALTILRNHGIIVAGDSAQQIIATVDQATELVRQAIEQRPRPVAPRAQVRFRTEQTDEDELRRIDSLIAAIAPLLRGLLAGDGNLAIVAADASALVRQETRRGSAIISVGPLLPDEIVYAGSFPCVIEPKYAPIEEQVALAIERYRREYQVDPVVVLLPGKVLFGIGPDFEAARNAVDCFTDALQVARDADRLGTVAVLTESQRQFIESWEAESYRQEVARTARHGRLESRVVLLTGASTVFGPGVARGLVAAGAHVVLADPKTDDITSLAEELCQVNGPGAAMAVKWDSLDPAGIEAALNQVLTCYGGIDVLVVNDPVGRPGAWEDQRLEDFDRSTQSVYRQYFQAVRQVVPVMSSQFQTTPQRRFDIMAIGSMAGLAASAQGFADVGAQFGQIGLTQALALELIDQGIKVNMICAGDYLDGPAWSDPDRGLLKQYLRSGRVPGASSIDDVRSNLEQRVPCRRGAVPADVVKAVLYLVDQDYETGQVLPVTGGRNLLR